MRRQALHERLFAALLRMFPSEFRGDFGDQMADDFRDQREDALKRGRRSAIRLWVKTVVDAVHRAPREHFDILRRDASYAVRLLRRRPGLAASALITLTIGIGLNTAVFSLVSGVLWRSLPLPESGRLVRVFQTDGRDPAHDTTSVAPANFIDWRAARSLDGIASLKPFDQTLIDDGDPEQVATLSVSSDFFRLVPMRPALGRLFNDADFARMTRQIETRLKQYMTPVPGTVVLSHDLWQRRFHGSRDVIGRTVRLGTATVEIVGVMDPRFTYPYAYEKSIDCWLPDVPDPAQRRARTLMVLGRLAPGATLADARAEFEVMATRLASAYPEANEGRGIYLEPLLESVTAGVRTQMWFLLGAAACVLLIVCANVANLLLAHTSGRRLELATRVALGASRGHLVRQALTEGLLLSAAGGAAGVMLAYWAVPALVSLAPATIPRLHEVSVDGRVLAFAAVVSIVVGLACGLGSSLSIDRRNATGVLRAAGADSAGHGRRFRQVLTVAEIAIALLLVITAGLLVRTMRVVGSLDLGFDPSNVIAVGLTPNVQKYPGETKAAYESELIARVRALPGVIAAGIGSRPLGGGGMATRAGFPPNYSAKDWIIAVDAVGPGYLEALGARLAAGRFFEERDNAGTPRVALVNQAAVKRFWPTAGAVGQIVLTDEPLQIVGVVTDVRRVGLEEDPRPTLYVPSAQTHTFWTNNMLVRTKGDPRGALPAIRGIMRQVDGEQALTRIQTLEERLADATAPRRYILWLVGLFSTLALGLAVIGVYAVVAESVAQRVPEIGVRMALGASRADVMGLVLRQGAWMIGVGLAAGGLAAVAFNKVMAGFVFRVATTDPLAYGAAGVCLALVTLAACAIPARRAARVDPVLALRAQ
jgi:putative ABC transport system permease protein